MIALANEMGVEMRLAVFKQSHYESDVVLLWPFGLATNLTCVDGCSISLGPRGKEKHPRWKYNMRLRINW